MDAGAWGLVVGFVGIAVTILVAAVTLFIQSHNAENRTRGEISAAETRMRTENQEAHRQIGENIRAVDSRLTAGLNAINRRDSRQAAMVLQDLGDRF